MKIGKVVQIEGNNNIVIQNVESSNITINYEFSKFLTKVPTIEFEEVIGRQSDLKAINQILENDSRLVLVNGVGGIGKTTLAKAYIKKYSDNFNHIIWLQCHESIKKTVVQNDVLIANLFLKGKESESNFNEIIEILLRLSGRNLIVIDNAEIVNDLEEFTERFASNTNWKFLITSRKTFAKSTTFAVDRITLKDATTLFYHYYKLEKNNDRVRQIIEIVEYHTLTIELLAKTGQRQNLSLDNIYETLFNEWAKPTNKNSAKLISTTIVDTFQNLDEVQQSVLLSFSVLPPKKYYPNEILFFLDKISEKENWEINKIENSINRLERNGWLLRGSSKENFTIHPLISEVVIRNLKPNLKLRTKIDILEYKNSLKEIVSKNQIQEAAKKLLLGLKDKSEHNEVVLILSRMEDINQKSRMGIVYERDAEVVRNQIRHSFLQLIDRIENIEIEYHA